MATMQKIFTAALVGMLWTVSACQAETTTVNTVTTSASSTINATLSEQLVWEDVMTFNEPWAMAVLPDGNFLVTEKSGRLLWVNVQTKQSQVIQGVPKVEYAGQGGLGDVVLHPDFVNNGWVYISYAEPEDGRVQGAAVMRAKLVLNPQGGSRLEQSEVIWRQHPKVTGHGHYGHRMVFGSDGHLWISSSERQKFQPAQDLQSNLGKIVRLKDDGSIPSDNPFLSEGGVAAQVWSLGHRNILGMAFDTKGRLWANEMGPKGGDEFNLIEKGGNYGYPIVSNGDHYSGRVIPNHDSHPEYIAPKITWTPVISPSSLLFYRGQKMPTWQGLALMGGLSSKALVVVKIEGNAAKEVARYDMQERIRVVAEDTQGTVWVLEDGKNGRLRQLKSF